jgi:signal transduction histidine kinase
MRGDVVRGDVVHSDVVRGDVVRGESPPRDWRADAGLIALAAVLGGLFLVDSVQTSARGDSRYPVADVVIGSLACVALLLRRRWPVVLALVLIPAISISTFSMGATAVALLAVAMYRSLRVTAAVVGLHATTVAALFALVAPDPREFWQGLVVLLALDAALVASGLLVRSQRLLVRSLRERAREAEEGQRLRLEEARHTERERIAREMHDVLGHRISLLAVHAGALEVRRSATEEERQAAGVIRQCAYEALEDLREVIGMLRGPATNPSDPDPSDADPSDSDPSESDPSEFDRPQPTLTDLPALIEQSRQAGAQVTLDSQLADLPPAPEGIGRHVYRIVQEGLTNARKHSPGAPVRVRVIGSRRDAGPVGESAGESLVVEVTNPLAGYTTGTRIPGAGSGLIGLSERMDLLGGRLEHGRTADGEFRLHAWLPWQP